ncbi:hypothetical protein FQZ97_937420 [compost metagenome]
MRIEQQRVAKLGLDPRQLGGQGLVVRRPDLGEVARPLRAGRLAAGAVQRLAGEQGRREQAGGGAGIERRIILRAVEVDDIARVARLQGTGAQLIGEVIEPRDMPVGIAETLRLLDQARLDGRRQQDAGMRHADQQRCAAAAEAQYVIHSRSPVHGESPAWANRRPTNRPAPPVGGSARRRSRRPCPPQGYRDWPPGPRPWRHSG